MSASPDDILTTHKNGVIALNNLGQTLNATLEKLYAALKPIQFYGGLLPSGSTDILYTTPSGKTANITGLMIANTAAVVKVFSVYVVPSGATLGVQHAIYLAVTIAANTTLTYTGSIAVPAGGTICGSSTGDVTLTITGTVLS